MDDEDLTLVSVGSLLEKKNKSRKQLCKTWPLTRDKRAHIISLKGLRSEPHDWKPTWRTDEASHNRLLKLDTPIIQKKDTNMGLIIGKGLIKKCFHYNIHCSSGL